MPALTSVKDFVAGAVLTAANMDEVNCGVKVFANAAARDAAYGGAGERTLEEGEMCYLNDTNAVLVYNGSSWVNAGGVGNAVISTAAGSYQGTVHEGGTVFDVWTYNASGSLVVTTAGLVDMLLVGGGGAGAQGQLNLAAGGGGGAGGYLDAPRVYLPAGTLTVVVGAGGASSGTNHKAGLSSRLGSFFAAGGGKAGQPAAPAAWPGDNGGSGGGGSGNTGTGGSGSPGLGNNGGNASGPYDVNLGGNQAGTGGGGGGSGGVGGNASPSPQVTGAGGAGTASTITGSSVTRAGGGSGGANSGTAGSTTGGGGAGGINNPGTAGGANTGGGGGGGATQPTSGPKNGGAGGSGVVIVRTAR